MAPQPAEVTAVVVTYGGVPLDEIKASLPFETFVWDNSKRQDLQCFGRFAALPFIDTPHVYVQDDDLIVDAARLLEHYDGDGVVANVPPDEEWNFIGGGAFFPTGLPDFRFYTERYGFDSDFHRVCDVVFAYGHPYRRVWVGYERLLPWHDAPNRMYRQPNHYAVRRLARERTLALKGHLG